jgi:chemotaxis regulatin CheY-phosphate phosphatase CheZ
MEAGKHIELSLGQEPGEFRLTLDGIVIIINLNSLDREKAGSAPERGTGAPVASIAGATTGPSREDAQEAGEITAELEYFRQVSHDIYEGLGKLAKDINLSIQDLSLAEIIQNAMRSPGEHLDQARNQVNDVLLMTEQATLNIMELVEQIREDCQTVQTKLLNLAAAQTPEGSEDTPASAAEEAGNQSLWDQVFSQAEELDRWLRPAGSEEAALAGGVPNISLAEVLQILLEFCTNEKVKQHIKAIQAKQDAIFRGPEAERALSLLAAGAPQEEGFYQLPLGQVLDLLKSHCEDERVQELFTKMVSSADKLFPVPALPLEAQDVEVEYADEAVEIQGNPKVETRWAELQETLQRLAAHRQTEGGGAAAGIDPHQAAAEVQEVIDTVDRITGSLSRIIEALAFQDLSGQRLLKILKLLRELQVQVLTLLVAAGEKLRLKLDDQAPSGQDSAQAREELDRLLASCASSAEQSALAIPEEQPLDQEAINDLLTTMGF